MDRRPLKPARIDGARLDIVWVLFTEWGRSVMMDLTMLMGCLLSAWNMPYIPFGKLLFVGDGAPTYRSHRLPFGGQAEINRALRELERSKQI